jgi:F-type H+-transporting ATPase subunit delta
VRDLTIARAYAEALFEVGQAHGEAEMYGPPFRALAEMFKTGSRTRRFFDTPRVTTEERAAVVRRALEGRVPQRFLHFTLVVLAKGRQSLFPEIADAYQTLVDESTGRHRAQVTLARRLDTETETLIAQRLSTLLGQTVEPEITVNPAIMGGLIMRYGDRLLDASLRRHLVALKREMMHAHLPGTPAASA